MSCEDKARAFGVYLVRRDKTTKRTETRRPIHLFVFERLGAVERRVLKVEWHTAAGAWQAALRWVKKLSRGEL